MGVEVIENLMTADFGNKLLDFFKLAEQGNLTPFGEYNVISFLVKLPKFRVLIRSRGRPIQCGGLDSRWE